MDGKEGSRHRGTIEGHYVKVYECQCHITSQRQSPQLEAFVKCGLAITGCGCSFGPFIIMDMESLSLRGMLSNFPLQDLNVPSLQLLELDILWLRSLLLSSHTLRHLLQVIHSVLERPSPSSLIRTSSPRNMAAITKHHSPEPESCKRTGNDRRQKIAELRGFRCDVAGVGVEGYGSMVEGSEEQCGRRVWRILHVGGIS